MAYVDGYGNIKTTWISAPAQMGDLVQITIGGAMAVAVVTDGTFAVEQVVAASWLRHLQASGEGPAAATPAWIGSQLPTTG